MNTKDLIVMTLLACTIGLIYCTENNEKRKVIWLTSFILIMEVVWLT